MPKRMRAVIYARYSTDLQSERSIDDQVALCREFAQKQGLTVREVYSDKAQTSASLIGRDGILRLVEDARAGKFDVVVVEALDRISRDQEDLAGIHKRLTFANVDILAVHDGLADEIQIGIRGLVGSLYLKDLKKKVRRGMQGVIRDGRHAGGKAYGYEPIPGKPGEMRILDHEADVIRRIFKEYLAGRTAREIANGLNEDGVIAPRGGSWNASTINGNKERGHGILLNPLYTGDLVWNRITMIRHPETGRRVSRVNPESEWMRKDVPDLPSSTVTHGMQLKPERRHEARHTATEGVTVPQSARSPACCVAASVAGACLSMTVRDPRSGSGVPLPAKAGHATMTSGIGWTRSSMPSWKS